jgi:hypothetical protein
VGKWRCCVVGSQNGSGVFRIIREWFAFGGKNAKESAAAAMGFAGGSRWLGVFDSQRRAAVGEGGRAGGVASARRRPINTPARPPLCRQFSNSNPLGKFLNFSLFINGNVSQSANFFEFKRRLRNQGEKLIVNFASCLEFAAAAREKRKRWC